MTPKIKSRKIPVETVSDFKLRLRTMIPKSTLTSDRPIVKSESDRGYFPPWETSEKLKNIASAIELWEMAHLSADDALSYIGKQVEQ